MIVFCSNFRKLIRRSSVAALERFGQSSARIAQNSPNAESNFALVEDNLSTQSQTWPPLNARFTEEDGPKHTSGNVEENEEAVSQEQLMEVLSPDKREKMELLRKLNEIRREKKPQDYPKPKISVRNWLLYLYSAKFSENTADDFLDYLSFEERISVGSNSEMEASLSSAQLELLREIQAEYEAIWLTDPKMPGVVSPKEWLKLITYEKQKLRKKFLYSLGNKEYVILSAISRARLRSEEIEIKRQEMMEYRLNNPDQIHYGLNLNNIFLRMYRSEMHKWQESRLRMPLTTGKPTICVDASFVPHLDPMSRETTVRQILHLYSINRHHPTPCRLLITDVDAAAPIWQQVLHGGLSFFHHRQKTECMAAELRNESYLDLFPRKRLVYLSPDGRETLRRLDEDDVYIIGGLADAGRESDRASVDKAGRDAIRCAAIPIDEFKWSARDGSTLKMRNVLQLLLDAYRNAGYWPQTPQRQTAASWDEQLTKRKIEMPWSGKEVPEANRRWKQREWWRTEQIERNLILV